VALLARLRYRRRPRRDGGAQELAQLPASRGGIESTDFLVPAAIVFGLSTDYGVFLLTRIKEAHEGWNWWSPAPLRRLHERLDIGEEQAAKLPAVTGQSRT
jgi:uncharacterized membrane protein YdfJ with MMPL/SSD domain